MTLTTEQLDELERKARAAHHISCAPVRYFRHPDAPMAVAWSPVIDGRDTCVPQSHADCYRAVDADHIAANSPDVTLRLIAIARAALAWRDAYDEMVGAQYLAVDGGRDIMNRAAERYHPACHNLKAALEGQP